MQVSEAGLDDRQPKEQLNEPSSICIECTSGKQQHRRERQCECVIGKHVRHDGDRTREEQRHQPKRVGVFVPAKRPENSGDRKGREAELDRHRCVVWQIDTAQIHENGGIERRRDAFRIREHQIVRGQAPGDEIDPHLRAEHQRGRGRKHERGDRGRREYAPAAGRDQHDGKQDAELRLQRQQPDQNANRNRPAVEPDENRDQHRGGDQRALPRNHAQHGGGREHERSQQAIVRDVVSRDREEQCSSQQGPYGQRLQIAQLPEWRGHEEYARRVRPVLAGIVRAEQRFKRAVIFGSVVESARIGIRRRAAVHPEIQEVATGHEAGAVARERPAPRHRVEITAGHEHDEEGAENHKRADRLSVLALCFDDRHAGRVPQRGFEILNGSLIRRSRS